MSSQASRGGRIGTTMALLFAGVLAAMAGCTAAEAEGFVRPEFFKGDGPVAFSTDGPLARALATEFGRRGYRVVERAKLDAVLSEQALTQSGLLQDDRYLAAGKIANVRYLITVSETADPGSPDVVSQATVRILDAQTGDLVGSINYRNSGSGFRGPMMGMGMGPQNREVVTETARRIADRIMTIKSRQP
jgi:hypothetical protein